MGKYRYQHSQFPPGMPVHIAECISGIYPEQRDIAGKIVYAAWGVCHTLHTRNGQCGCSHDAFVPVIDEQTGLTYLVEQNFVSFAEAE